MYVSSLHKMLAIWLSVMFFSQKLIDKVKNWLAPSSWLSYLSPAKQGKSEPHSSNQEQPSNSQPPRNHTASSPPLDQERPRTEGKAGSSKKKLETADIRATLSLLEHVLNDDDPPVVNDSTHSSDSWVAEEDDISDPPVDDDIGMEHGTGTLNGNVSTEHMEPASGLSVECADSPTRVVTELQEHTVQLVNNPVYLLGKNASHTHKATPALSKSVRLSQRLGSGLSDDLSRRLYSNSTVVTSTPQLSPVREQQEERVG